MSQSLVALATAFYERASETDEGRRFLLKVAPEFLGACVYDFDIEDATGLHLVYRDGRLSVFDGLYTGPTNDVAHVVMQTRYPDLEDILEGRLAAADAHRDRKIYMAVQPELNKQLRPYVFLWGVLTRIGQEVVRADKARRTSWLALPEA